MSNGEAAFKDLSTYDNNLRIRCHETYIDDITDLRHNDYLFIYCFCFDRCYFRFYRRVSFINKVLYRQYFV